VLATPFHPKKAVKTAKKKVAAPKPSCRYMAGLKPEFDKRNTKIVGGMKRSGLTGNARDNRNGSADGN
jgi:hypothetical protein